MTSEFIASTDLPERELVGLIGLVSSFEETAHTAQFRARWPSLNETLYPAAKFPEPTAFALFSYDVVTLFAHAIHAAISAETDVYDGLALMDRIAQTTFIGLTGNITLDFNYDRVSQYSVVNYQGGANMRTVGTWRVDQTLHLTTPLRFSGNTTEIPFLKEDVPTSESNTVFILVIVLSTTIVVIVGVLLLVAVLMLRRRRAQVVNLEVQNKQLNLETRALNSRLDTLSEMTSAESGRTTTSPVIDIPVNQVLSLLWRLQGTVHSPKDLQDINAAIEAIQSNVLFTPETKDANTASRDLDTREWIRATLIESPWTGEAQTGLSRAMASISLSATGKVDSLDQSGQLAATIPGLADPDFDIFTYAHTDAMPLRSIFVAIVQERGLLSVLGIDKVKFAKFAKVLDLACEGTTNAFHNVLHSAHSLQYAHYILTSSGLYNILSPLDAFAAFLLSPSKTSATRA
ncbi:uncharacterized protein AMSG_11618 [Thecamonas trahens ATCC 50062]|uniref:PDEase domain-containing protein n=1 Tax=Thecamonas trahens ATCC 50062 TaxID=461836 RepID=A0A0L0DH66_THETB|nr:hypothetical protein AMSG_11618 [Thecamonas trahens ATCC 50062]KNC50648.1 hypothetical protein AMSG_11618 [Thecamonas trahens ATCC 50062]|eukprot:XP_013762597.1 hypothetical protein AMSG_11618 [Thecamonas trahens ATCC 50062]